MYGFSQNIVGVVELRAQAVVSAAGSVLDGKMGCAEPTHKSIICTGQSLELLIDVVCLALKVMLLKRVSSDTGDIGQYLIPVSFIH